MNRSWMMLCLLLATWSGLALAADEPALPDQAAMDHELQALKEEVLLLNRDLLMLQEDLLFPASRQMAVYLSMDRGSLFQLDSVELRLNEKLVTTHLYSERER